MDILSVLACGGFYTSPARGKLVGGPSGPLSKKVCRPLM